MDRTVKVRIWFIGMYSGVRTKVNDLCANDMHLRKTIYYYCKTLISGAYFYLALLAVKQNHQNMCLRKAVTQQGTIGQIHP